MHTRVRQGRLRPLAAMCLAVVAWGGSGASGAEPAAHEAPGRAAVSDVQDVRHEQELAVIAAREHIAYAYSLSQRHAHYAARQEFILALRGVARALDLPGEGADHEQALDEALRAFRNAEHAALAPDATAAVQAALQEARRQAAHCGGREPTASDALYGWGRIELVVQEQTGKHDPLVSAKAVALHQAALVVDADNALAANELGVLLARFGRLPEARQALLRAVQTDAVPEMWHNLAVVYRWEGDEEQARRAAARQAAMQKTQGHRGPAPDNIAALITWAEPTEFVRRTAGTDDAGPAPSAATPGAAAAPTGRAAAKGQSFSVLPTWFAAPQDASSPRPGNAAP